MKIKIYTYADKRPDFIPLQFRSINKFVKGDVEYIVFNNGSTASNRDAIYDICKSLDIKHEPIQNRVHLTPSIACAYPIQWSFHEIISKDEDCIACIIDSDMFFINYIDIEKYTSSYDIAGVKQRREHIRYLWNGILFMNMARLPDKTSMNFMCGRVEGVETDVGGFLYYWLLRNKNLRIKHIRGTDTVQAMNNNLNCLPHQILDEYNEDYRYEIFDKVILHYGRGSNWDNYGEDYHINKTKLAEKFVNGCVDGSIILPDFAYYKGKDCWGEYE